MPDQTAFLPYKVGMIFLSFIMLYKMKCPLAVLESMEITFFI